MSKKITIFFLILTISVFSGIFAQENGTNGNFQLSGEVIGMFTLGFADSDQIIFTNPRLSPSGVYDDINDGNNGYFTKMDFRLLYNPVPFIDIFIKLYARSRPGSPYVPLQLEGADYDNFSVSFDYAWARINAIEGLGLDIPLDLFLRTGKFDSAPASFQNITRFGTESVMEKIRTKNIFAFQMEAVMPLPFAEALSISAATSLQLNEAITPLYDTDGSIALHGSPGIEDKYDIPVFASVQLRNINTPIGLASAEGVYAYNAEGIYSGHSFGADGRFEISIPGIESLAIPLGIGFAVLEKNIDPMAKIAVNRPIDGDTDARINAISDHENDWHSVSFRRSLRVGAGIGIRFNPSDILAAELNIGYAYTQAAHFYRDTITLHSASIDMLAVIDNRFFVGGGIFFGSLVDTEWKTSADTPVAMENNYLHTFTFEENMGFEVYAGLKFNNSRLVFGYNLNRGLSMNNSLEALRDSQIVHRQPGTEMQENLFQRGGFFTKLVISW